MIIPGINQAKIAANAVNNKSIFPFEYTVAILQIQHNNAPHNIGFTLQAVPVIKVGIPKKKKKKDEIYS